MDDVRWRQRFEIAMELGKDHIDRVGKPVLQLEIENVP